MLLFAELEGFVCVYSTVVVNGNGRTKRVLVNLRLISNVWLVVHDTYCYYSFFVILLAYLYLLR